MNEAENLKTASLKTGIKVWNDILAEITVKINPLITLNVIIKKICLTNCSFFNSRSYTCRFIL